MSKEHAKIKIKSKNGETSAMVSGTPVQMVQCFFDLLIEDDLLLQVFAAAVELAEEHKSKQNK